MIKSKKLISSEMALLIARIIIGGIFVMTGWMKVTDMGMTLAMFSSMHIPAFLSYIVAYGELIGGILLILGLWTENVTAFLIIIMIVAIILTWSAGFAVVGLPIATLAALVAIHGNGSGKFGVKYFLRKV